MKPAVFLDRDGTLNRLPAAGEYVRSPEQVELLRGAAHAVGMLRRAGYLCVIASNQRGVALGLMTENELEAVDARVRALIGDSITDVDAGVAAGCRTLRVQPVDFSLLDAAHSIIAGNAQPAWKAEPSCTSVLSPAKKIISIVP